MFRSLGVDVVRGGQSMNPSAGEVLEAIERTPDNWAVVLPNNSNIYLTARQAAEQSEKDVHVIATRTLPQGFAAALAFNPADSSEDNAEAMSEAAGDVTTLEVTQAVRDAGAGRQPGGQRRIHGAAGRQIRRARPDAPPGHHANIGTVAEDEPEALTIYVGQTTPVAQAEEWQPRSASGTRTWMYRRWRGGQDHYDYIIAVE